MPTNLATTTILPHSKQLLDLTTTARQLAETFRALRQQYEDLTSLTGYNREADYKAQITAEQGVAININQTVRCFHDERRTLLFLRGMVRAIRAKQQQHPDEVIQVCYAGCGPYAPFFTLVAPLFEPEEIQFSLLEINPLSLKLAQQLTHQLGLEDYLRRAQVADAVTHRFDASTHFHILFSETLDAALHRECFVPILLNLLPQLDQEVTLIPENVIVRASLLQASAVGGNLSEVRNPEAVYEEQVLGPVFDVRQSIQPHVVIGQTPKAFTTHSYAVSNFTDYDYLILNTDVQVYADLWLYRGESLLTEPLIRNMDRLAPAGNRLQFTYQLSPEVELKVH